MSSALRSLWTQAGPPASALGPFLESAGRAFRQTRWIKVGRSPVMGRGSQNSPHLHAFGNVQNETPRRPEEWSRSADRPHEAGRWPTTKAMWVEPRGVIQCPQGLVGRVQGVKVVRSWPQREGPWAVGRRSGSLVLVPRAGHGPSEMPGLFNRPVLSGPETLHHLPSAACRPHDLSGGWRYTSRAAGGGSSGRAGLDSASTPSTYLLPFTCLVMHLFLLYVFPCSIFC